MDNLMKYTMQLAMLNQLRDNNMVTRTEYDSIKTVLKKRYKIIDALAI